MCFVVLIGYFRVCSSLVCTRISPRFLFLLNAKTGFWFFYNNMNSIHDTFKFEMSHSTERIAFLDTMKILKKDSINTTIYKNPTDICSLLHAQSFQPNNCKKGIFYSQALPHRIIISDNEEFKLQINELLKNLAKRGYNLNLINSIFKKVR